MKIQRNIWGETNDLDQEAVELKEFDVWVVRPDTTELINSARILVGEYLTLRASKDFHTAQAWSGFVSTTSLKPHVIDASLEVHNDVSRYFSSTIRACDHLAHQLMGLDFLHSDIINTMILINRLIKLTNWLRGSFPRVLEEFELFQAESNRLALVKQRRKATREARRKS